MPAPALYLFETRIMLRKAICMMGPDAAALFYGASRFGAMPGRIQKTLLGKGGVHGLDGDAHRRRKSAMDEVALYDELHELLTRAVCTWAGVLCLDQTIIGRRPRQSRLK